jgi:hypothetical protein
MLTIDPLDMKVFGAVLVLLVILYFWVRVSQCRQKTDRRMKERCRDLILDNRHALAAAGVDIEGLINMVRMQITCEQLDAVIKLLLRPRRHYDVDRMDAPGFLDVDLDIDRKPEGLKERKAEATTGESEPAPAVAAVQEDQGGEPEPETQAAPARNATPDRMEPEEEKAWLNLAHKRFRDALTKRGLSERRARLKLLVKMVELGKRAVDEDLSKSGVRKEYERHLWDRFYENEYLDLNAD